MASIPHSLKSFFQEYNFLSLNTTHDSFTIIERVLQFGNRAEIKWLFNTYPNEKIKDWVKQLGKERLPQPHLNFWQIVLEIEE